MKIWTPMFLLFGPPNSIIWGSKCSVKNSPPYLAILWFSLTLQYKDYEEIVVEHRAMKERMRLKQEQEDRERRAATRVGAHLKKTLSFSFPSPNWGKALQWNLWIKDTLKPAILFFVERVSSSQRLKKRCPEECPLLRCCPSWRALYQRFCCSWFKVWKVLAIVRDTSLSISPL